MDHTQKGLLGKVVTWFREKAATVKAGVKATEKGVVAWYLVEE